MLLLRGVAAVGVGVVGGSVISSGGKIPGVNSWLPMDRRPYSEIDQKARHQFVEKVERLIQEQKQSKRASEGMVPPDKMC